MNEFSRLPCATHPRPDELLSSWLVRLAQAHRIRVYSFCQQLWPDVGFWKRDLDKLPPAVVLATLAARTSTPADRIAQTTLAPVIERLTGAPLTTGVGHTAWLMPLVIFHRTHRGYGLVYCPHCLRQDGATPYYRTAWRLAFHVVCPTCGVYLLEGCPACGAPVNFFRLGMGRRNAGADRPISTCYQCAFELSQAPTRAVTSSNLRWYRSLYRISREGWNPSVPYPHQYLRVLRQVVRVLSCPFGQAGPLQVDLRIRLNQPVEGLTGGGSFERMPIAERIYLLEQAMWLLGDWPDRFITVMRYHQIKSYTLLRDMTGEVPFWYDSIVTEHFYVTRTNRRFMPPSPARVEYGRNRLVAPLKGLAGAPRQDDARKDCPHCNSRWSHRDRIVKGKQRYTCQQCHRHFTE